MGRTNQMVSMEDNRGDGLIENSSGSKGVRVVSEDGTELLKASGSGGENEVSIPVKLVSRGGEADIGDMISDKIVVGTEKNFLLFAEFTDTDSDRVEIDGDLSISGELTEGANL